MFDDRLEIYSLGGMPDGRLVQDLDLRNVSSKRRNPIIADIFNRLNYMDRRGSGFKKILDSYEFQENYTGEMKPEFRSGNNEFWLIFKNLNYKKSERTKTSEQKQANKTSVHIQEIREYLSVKDDATTSEIAALIGLSDARTRAILSKMDDVLAVGATNKRIYRLQK